MRSRSILSVLELGLALGLSACTAERRAPCPTGNDRLGLTPTGAVTVDGLSVQRSTTTGLFETDAGVRFDVNASEVSALDDPQNEGCPMEASAVTLTVTDPFSGVTSAVTATR